MNSGSCKECGNPLTDKRSDARVCSRECSNQAFRKSHPGHRLSWQHKVENYAALVRELLDVQEGKCYLCERDLNLDDAVIDHDHSCCGSQRSCEKCRRGAAHNNCNKAIGFFNDDPNLLHLVADNLKKANFFLSS